MPRSGHRRARWHGTGTPRFLLRRHGAIRIPGTHRTRADTPRFHMVERWSDDVEHASSGPGCYSRRNSSWTAAWSRSEEHTSELQSRGHLVCSLVLEKKKKMETGQGS